MLDWYSVSFQGDRKYSGIRGNGAHHWMYQKPLNCTLYSGENGIFYNLNKCFFKRSAKQWNKNQTKVLFSHFLTYSIQPRWGKLCFDCTSRHVMSWRKLISEISELVLAVIFKSWSPWGSLFISLGSSYLRWHPGVHLPNVWVSPGLDPRTTWRGHESVVSLTHYEMG